MSSADNPCPCLEARYTYHRVRRIGVDETDGRYGDVELWQCVECQRYWLYYFVEYEHRSRSGRYFLGLITLEQADDITPENAVGFLESLDWYICGGSYFDGKTGRRSNYAGQRLPVVD